MSPEDKTPAPFARSGLAARSDLVTPEWRDLFSILERHQSAFLEKAVGFRSREYKWPRDPLHTWSRVWEYPYAYFHLKRWRARLPAVPVPQVVDLGSGVTFFPFSVAQLGCHVICTDTDPVAEIDLQRAVPQVPHAPGTVGFRACGEQKLPFAAGEVDAVFCISVLEHIPNPEHTITEIARILKRGGLLVLTIDLDLRGDSAIDIASYQRLLSSLLTQFDFACPEVTIHPADLLDSSNSPYAVTGPKGVPLCRFWAREMVRRILGKEPRHRVPYRLAVDGSVFTRKSN